MPSPSACRSLRINARFSERIARSKTVAPSEVLRAKVLVDASDRVADVAIARRREVTAVAVRAGRRAFEVDALTKSGMLPERRGTKATVDVDEVAENVELIHQNVAGIRTGRPARWQSRTRVSEELVDVVGLQLDPPEQAVALCMDEKSQIQGLDRNQDALSRLPRKAFDCAVPPPRDLLRAQEAARVQVHGRAGQNGHGDPVCACRSEGSAWTGALRDYQRAEVDLSQALERLLSAARSSAPTSGASPASGATASTAFSASLAL